MSTEPKLTRPDQAKHAEGHSLFGVDGDTGKVVDMKVYGLLESASVKIQTLKTAIEVCCPLETAAYFPRLTLARSLRLCFFEWTTLSVREDRKKAAAGVEQCRRWEERWVRAGPKVRRCKLHRCIAAQTAGKCSRISQRVRPAQVRSLPLAALLCIVHCKRGQNVGLHPRYWFWGACILLGLLHLVHLARAVDSFA